MQQRQTIFNRLILIVAISLFAVAKGYSHGPRYTHLATSASIAENPDHSWTVEEVAKGFYNNEFICISKMMHHV